MKLKTTLLLSILLIGGCASRKRKFSDQVSPDLVQTFNLKNSKFDKFKVVDEDEVPKEDKGSEQIEVKKIESSTPKIVEKKPKKSKVKTPDKKDEIVGPKESNNTKPDEKTDEPQKLVKVVDNTEDEVSIESYPEIFEKYDKESRRVWSRFKPNVYPGEEFVMDVSYLGVTAGHVKIRVRNKVKIAGKTAYHYSAHLKSAKFYSMIYSLDDKIETYVDVDEFLPIKFSLIQRESNKTVDDLQLFDLENKTTYFWYKRLKDGKTTKREKTSFIPGYFQDNFSSLFFVRGLPLSPGASYKFPLVTRGKILLMDMDFGAYETIRIMNKDVPSIRVDAQTIFPGVMKKKGKITFWYSNDEARKLLKFEAKIKIGAIKGELIQYKEGQKRRF